MRRLLASPAVRALGYLTLGNVLFALFAYWTFPYERVRDYLVQEVERPRGANGTRTPSGYQLEIASLSPSFFTGVELEGVRFATTSSDAAARTTEVHIERLFARISLLALLGGTVEIAFEAEAGGGSIEGVLAQGDEESRVEADIDSLDLGRMQVLSGLVGLPVTGVATGKIALTVPADATKSTGEVALTIARVTVGDGRAKLKLGAMAGEGLTIERLDAGTIELAAKVEAGKLRISKLRSNGADLELEGSGAVDLASSLGASTASLMLRIEISDAYRNRNDRTRGLFSLLELSPQVRPFRSPDGAIQLRLSGPLRALRPSPAGSVRLPSRTAARGNTDPAAP